MSSLQTPMMVFPEATASSVPFYNNPQYRNTFSVIVFGTALFAFLGYKGLQAFLLRFLAVPPHGYTDLIQTALDQNGAIPNGQVGAKHGSFRRRLVLAAKKPQLYSTVPLVVDPKTTKKTNPNRIRIARIDKDENPDFLAKVKPILPEDDDRRVIFGYFHPYSDANGGGERVLWEAVMSTLKHSPKNIAVVYTFTSSDDKTVSAVLKEIKATFGLNFFDPEVQDRLVLIQLDNKLKWLVDGKSWKHFTIIGQALGSIYVSLVSLSKLIPDIFIDTMGLPFSYPLISIFLDIPVVSYIHYPLISSDMLGKLDLKTPYGWVKYVYWRSMMKLYEIVGGFIDVSICNSTWTLNHIKSIWKSVVDLYPPTVMYPPTGIDETKIVDPVGSPKEHIFLYIAQFRPEKRHELLLREYKKYLEQSQNPYKLVLVGSTRSVADEENVKLLKSLAKELELESHVIFEVNCPREKVDEYLVRSEFGLNAMWNEHFGISVVEYMLYGLIPIVHASAGPLYDIVLPVDPATKEIISVKSTLLDESSRSGLFFTDPSDPDFNKDFKYDRLWECFVRAEELSDKDRLKLRSNANYVAKEKFGKSVFSGEWNKLLDFVTMLELYKRRKRGKVEQLY